MALTSTVYNFEITLNDADREVYETLSLRVALHPSESMEHMLTRVLAYCLEYEPGIAFSKGGVSEGDQPPVSIASPDGRIKTWIDVGLPDAERLNKASKAAERVTVYTHRDPATLKRQTAGQRIHRAENIAVVAIDRRFLEELVPLIDRRTSLELTVTGGQLYLTTGGQALSCTLTEHRLEASDRPAPGSGL
jgi:uncharacterized protein YaeQ